MMIVGAGLTGLLAAHAWPTAPVVEAESGPHASHQALLRFRSQAVAHLTGIDFAPVSVRKGIWFKNAFVEPNIQLANFYASKTTGQISGERSIWDLRPVERFIAPESFYEQMVEAVGKRIQWGSPYDFSGRTKTSEPVITTAPLQFVMEACGMEKLSLLRAAIRVDRFRVGTNVYQTIYFPDPEKHVYRASITGSLLICESTVYPGGFIDLQMVANAFGQPKNFHHLSTVEQRYGKIIPLPTDKRKVLLHRLTSEFNIYSLGRFATWRNCLLDDVVQDISVIRRLMKADNYDRLLDRSS